MKTPIAITEINIVPVKPNNGLLGFCSFVIDDRFYVGSVAIFSRMDGNGIRLVYPKKNGINCFHPIKKELGEAIVKAISNKFYFLSHNDNLYEHFRTSKQTA